MSHELLYATGTAAGEPAAALGIALETLQELLGELESDNTFVVVQGHSHTITPTSVQQPGMMRSERPGYIATVTTVVEIS